MKYIIERQTTSNPRVLEMQDDGTFKIIAYGAGDESTDALLALARLANRAVRELNS